jgi:hypothetical protein
MGHNLFSAQPHAEEHYAYGHRTDPASRDRDASKAEVIAGGKVLICGGMGKGAYKSMRRLKIQPVVSIYQYR